MLAGRVDKEMETEPAIPITVLTSPVGVILWIVWLKVSAT
jgi:hypothetical protein